MSKLDQLKALGANKRAERQSSRGGGESRPAPLRNSPSKPETPVRPPQHMTPPVLDTGSVVSMGKKPAGVAPGPRDAKPKGRGGRPLEKDRQYSASQTKPWEAAGMSRASWYRRQKERQA